MVFEPIAIVGQSCVLPGALGPSALWDAVVAGRDLIGVVPRGRWSLAARHVMGTTDDSVDRTWSDRGGYVTGFEDLFDVEGFALHPDEIRALDPLFQWVLHCGREALAGVHASRARTGVVLGNLSFPSSSMARFAERTWLGDALADQVGVAPVHARNRFTSGLPAHLLARALGLGGDAFALDAACASSLYAIKIACDRLHDHSADAMLAGAVNRADDLFIHVGFCALQALSRCGESRPFDARADGLVPAEGAGLVALKRLSDAQEAGDTIAGVIRGIGLSNDGRGGGFLAPSPQGQVRAMRQAYASAGVSPEEISLIECHATGTPVGDGAEIDSGREVFAGLSDVPVGSLKSNMGHLITAAGVAGLIKVLGAIEHGTRPPTLHADQPIPELTGSPFRLLQQAEPWDVDGPRRAAVSAFGFGGNNAHLIVEEHTGTSSGVFMPQRSTSDVAIVGLGVVAGDCQNTPAFVAALRSEDEGSARVESISLSARDLRFPPRDLAQTLPQQLAVLKVALEALAQVPSLPHGSTGTFVGMGCDPEVARYGARWRVAGWAGILEVDDPAWLEEARDAFVPPLEAAGVVGTMPNILANRLNSQFDLGGASFTVSSEELSGVRALEIAVRALRAGELDAALVGAVDLSCEPVHERALAELGETRATGDAAVILVLKRVEDARRDGDRMIATITDRGRETTPWDGTRVTARFGHPHAASGLLQVAAAALSQQPGAVRIDVNALEGQHGSVVLIPGESLGPTATGAGAGGSSLTWPAHADTVEVPALPARDPFVHVPPLEPATTEAQIMRPAPWLPPETEEGATAPGDDRATPRRRPPTPVSSTGPAAVAVAATKAGAMTRVYTRLAEQKARVAEVHRSFLIQQSETQQRYLKMCQSNLLRLLDACPPGNGTVSGLSNGVDRVSPGLDPSAAIITDANAPAGPTFDRTQLIVHASGNISELFGAAFKPQDARRRQTRMPMPPLLLVDRVTGLDAEVNSMGLGTIWTETDVTQDAWYLHDGRMPSGIMVEAGQADLMLISYLGADLAHAGDRTYRLLGCELTYHGGLPRPGDTLRYDIHVDGHAELGDVRMFFFHYGCEINGEPRLTVRNGQAGFFTDAELAESAGVLWEAETGEHCDDPRLASPAVSCVRNEFSADQVRSFAKGRVVDCFGPGFEMAYTHTRTPRIPGDRMLLLDRVTHFDPKGGPWGRGYLRAVDTIAPDDWFFDGHFHNDPCMPGTLMLEGCMQAAAFFLTGLGYTLDKDGWVFEPVPDETCSLRCRGQVTPESKELVYELFVEEVIDGPLPTLYADLLCTVDGLKAFHCRRLAVQLAPAWPLDSKPEMLAGRTASAHPPGPDDPPETALAQFEGFRFDYPSLLACAWGQPSHAFGPTYARFDGPSTVPRLPGPPYHFMSRVLSVDAPMGELRPGVTAEVEYDVPPDAWYFSDNGARTMPLCVLMEAALQPCGWLASYVGSTLVFDTDVRFRNLDGTGTQTHEVAPDTRVLRTRARLTDVSRTAGMVIESFEVECFVGDQSVFTMKTVFGFFPAEALASQVGLPTRDEQRAVLTDPSDFFVDLTRSPDRYCAGSARLATPHLRMLHRVTGHWPEAGEHSSSGGSMRPTRPRYRAEFDVDPDHWCFKAHFFQDPVQPGSLGIEAMVQLLQFAMLHRGLDEGIERGRFEPLALDRSVTWKYRGQVLPNNRLVHVTLDIVEEGHDEHGAYAVGEASLWVDGMRIYEATQLGMRIVPGGESESTAVLRNMTLDPGREPWLLDHRPTWTVPVLPMMSMVELLASAVQEQVVGLRDVKIKRWLVLPGPREVRTEVDGGEVTLLASQGTGFEVVATGRVLTGSFTATPPAPLAPIDGDTVEDPYGSGRLFHGPSLQKLERLVLGPDGASAILSADPGSVPAGRLNQALLDAATHAIPHDQLHLWCAEIPEDVVAYPAVIPEFDVFGPTPTAGEVRCEVRFAGLFAGPTFPMFDVQLIRDDEVWVRFRLVEACFPKGPIGMAPPADRVAFLRDRRFVPGVSLSRFDGDETRLLLEDLRRSDWLPGTIEAVYGTSEPIAIARNEHVATRVGLHPGEVAGGLPLSRFPMNVSMEEDAAVVRATGPEQLDLDRVKAYWSERLDIGRWPVEDLYYGLAERFLRRVVLEDSAAFEAVEGRSVLYLANHQVGVESLLFSVVLAGLTGVPTVTLAKTEHRHTWLGQLIEHSFTYPGVTDPGVMVFFDRDDRESLPRIIGDLAAEMMGPGKSVLVHVEGTRSRTCRDPVRRMSSAFVDMALQVGAPIVPVRLVGGLPTDPLDTRIEFPHRMGRQDFYLGRPILPEELSALPYKERKERVIEGINRIGPDNAVEEPGPGDPEFAASVAKWVTNTGATEEHAVLLRVLQACGDPCDEVAHLLRGIEDGHLRLSDDDRGRWMAQLARRLFGERGPTIELRGSGEPRTM